VKFIDQSFSKETILWCQHKYKTLSKILHFGAGKVLRLKSNSSTNAFPYLQHVHIAQTDVVYQFHLVPLSSNEFQWSRMVYQFQFPTFKMAVDGIFPPTCLSRQKQIFPWKHKKKHLSVVFKFLTSTVELFHQSLTLTNSSWEPEVTKCLIEENVLRHKAFLNSSTWMNYMHLKK